MPADAPQNGPWCAFGAGVGPPYRRRPARLSEGRLRALRGGPSRGVRSGSGDGPEQLRNAGVAKIPELKM
nr:MAG TPA: hypothetical protein [Caudoviricetes sp.]